MICRGGFCVCGVSAAGCWFGRRLAKERSALVHSVGRYAPVRLRARTLSGIPGGFLYAPRKMLRAEARGHNSQLALLRQVSPGLQRIFQRASSLHPGGPCPESPRRCVLAWVGCFCPGRAKRRGWIEILSERANMFSRRKSKRNKGADAKIHGIFCEYTL